MMNTMKKMNENELDQVTGGFSEAFDRFCSTEILNDEMVSSFWDSVCDGFSIIEYVLFG